MDGNGQAISHQQFVIKLRQRASQLVGAGELEQARLIQLAAERAARKGEPGCRVCREAAE